MASGTPKWMAWVGGGSAVALAGAVVWMATAQTDPPSAARVEVLAREAFTRARDSSRFDLGRIEVVSIGDCCTEFEDAATGNRGNGLEAHVRFEVVAKESATVLSIERVRYLLPVGDVREGERYTVAAKLVLVSRDGDWRFFAALHE